MISVVMPLFNKRETVERTLRTVAAQTFREFEVVVVDDGSTDGSAEIVEALGMPNLRIIRQANAGVSAARNKGIREAHGEFVAFLDADDEWEADYLATQAGMAERYPQCSVFGTNYRMVDPEGKVRETVLKKLPFEGEEGELTNYFEVASASYPPLWTSAVMVRKRKLEDVGGFPLGIASGEDLLTWARLAARHGIAYNKRQLSVFHIEGLDVSEKPKRVPAERDYVGEELEKLARECKLAGINSYISLWHKMRSSIYMRLHMRGRSIREALKGLRYNPLNYKLYIYIAVNLIPRGLSPVR